MREYKFRAFNVKYKRMEYFNSHKSGILYAGKEFLVNSGYGSYDEPTFEDDTSNDFRIMQYIGLKDKNGKEICEGDLMQTEILCRHPKGIHHGDYWVIFLCKVFYSLASFKCEPVRQVNFTDMHFGLNRSSDICDGPVLGNIYENPELLKE